MRFSERIWSLLRRIPRGRVATYADLARAVGKPRAARAAAQACARNAHPIVVPCHRVVRSDGTLGGYSGPGGVQRKAALLREEGVSIRGSHISNLNAVRYNGRTK